MKERACALVGPWLHHCFLRMMWSSQLHQCVLPSALIAWSRVSLWTWRKQQGVARVGIWERSVPAAWEEATGQAKDQAETLCLCTGGWVGAHQSWWTYPGRGIFDVLCCSYPLGLIPLDPTGWIRAILLWKMVSGTGHANNKDGFIISSAAVVSTAQMVSLFRDVKRIFFSL